MQVQLHIMPGVVWDWEKFCHETPPYSIALDGFVAEGPRFSFKGLRANFNHHEGVDRLATRATCSQILLAVDL